MSTYTHSLVFQLNILCMHAFSMHAYIHTHAQIHMYTQIPAKNLVTGGSSFTFIVFLKLNISLKCVVDYAEKVQANILLYVLMLAIGGAAGKRSFHEAKHHHKNSLQQFEDFVECEAVPASPTLVTYSLATNAFEKIPEYKQNRVGTLHSGQGEVKKKYLRRVSSSVSPKNTSDIKDKSY